MNTGLHHLPKLQRNNFATFAAVAGVSVFAASQSPKKATAAAVPEQPALSERIAKEHSPRDDSFFTIPDNITLLQSVAASRPLPDETKLLTFLKERASKLLPDLPPNKAANTLSRFDAFVDYALVHAPRKSQSGSFWEIPGCLRDGAVLTHSEDLLVQKCLLLLSLSEKPKGPDEFPTMVLISLGARKSAYVAILQVCLFIPDEETSTFAISLASNNESHSKSLLNEARAKFKPYRDAATAAGISPLARAVWGRDPTLDHVISEQLPTLLDQIIKFRIAARQQKLDKTWSDYEAWYADTAIKTFRRVDITKPDLRNNTFIGATTVWGRKIGQRNLDYIPIGAKMIGVRASYTSDLQGIQFLYELDGKKGETPWRGGRDETHVHEIPLKEGEYIQEFKAGAGPKGKTISLLLVTNKRELYLSDSVYAANLSIQYDSQDHAENGYSIHGVYEPDAMPIGIPIGLVTYSNGDIHAFGLVLQSVVGSSTLKKLDKESVWRGRPEPEVVIPQ